MRAGFGQFSQPSQEYLRFCAQFGATDVLLNSANLPGNGGRWQLHDLVKLRLTVEQYGLSLSALENVPISFYDHIMLGGPRRDEQVENMIATVRNIARAGIPIFGYHWMPSMVWRTTPAHIRCGAVATAFDYGEAREHAPHPRPGIHRRGDVGEPRVLDQDHHTHRRGGGHTPRHTPLRPSGPVLGGIPQLLRSFDAYKRLVEIYPSDSNGIEFCQGTFSEMEGEDIYEMIRYFGERRKILYVHFRNVSGQVPRFHEEFINTGYVDMHRAMTIYHEVGFDGFFIDDHVPQTFQDTEWGHRGRAFANGYIQAMIEAVTKTAG